MKKQLETKGLKPLIYKAEIHQTIDSLQQLLTLYRKSESAFKHLYHIHQEFDALTNQLSDLKMRIENLINED